VKLKRKSIVISSFILLDCLFAGLIVSGKVIGKTANTVAHANSKNSTSLVEKMSLMDEKVTDDIGYSTVSQEDILIAQEIMMDNQRNAIEVNQISTLVNNHNLNADKITSNIEKSNSNALAAKKKREQEQAEIAKSLAENRSSDFGIQISQYALNFLGKKYQMGGQWNGEMPYTPTDCSGFVQGLYKHFGINIPRGANSQQKVGRLVSIKDIQPGDLVYYSDGGPVITHASMYIGNGKIIHAATPAQGIKISSVFIMKRMAIRRIVG
jgi:cell wall-associated NlpC family hydrolase